MSDQSEPGSAESANENPASEKPAAVKRPPAKAPVKPGPGQRPLLLAAAIALVAGALGGAAVAGLWRPASGASAKFADQEVTDAKKDVCSAAALARQAVANNMHLKNPDPENPVAQLAVAANARLSLTAGAAYVRGRLEANPATSQDLGNAARAMASELEHLNLSYLVGQPNSDREQLGRDLDARIGELGKLCQ